MRSQQNGYASGALPLPPSLDAASIVEAATSTHPRRALIIGANPAGSSLARDLKERAPEPILPIAFGDDDPAKWGKRFSGLPVISTNGDLTRRVANGDIQMIFAGADGGTWSHLPVPVYDAAAYYEKTWSKIPSEFISEAWFDAPDAFPLSRRPLAEKGKRVFDFFASAFLLVFCVPIYAVVALAVKWDSPGPVFYHQKRTGKDGKEFFVHKFRSMRQDAEKGGSPQWASENDSRITRVGNFLRKTRLDEFPQFWNVLIGEMSLIGPRPERPEFDEKLRKEIPHYMTRYSVRPGISGWAQVMYTYASSVEDAREKLAFDLYYLKHGSPSLDFSIFLRTVQVALLGKGR